MEENYNQAFTEVLEVINNSTEEIKNKIPKQFMLFLEQNADKEYVVKIDFEDSKWEDSLKQESLAVLALIYRDYIVSPEEKEKLLIEEQEEIARIEEEIREKYNPDNVFKTHKDSVEKEDSNSNDIPLTVYKESIFTKIKNWLKKIFRK